MCRANLFELSRAPANFVNIQVALQKYEYFSLSPRELFDYFKGIKSLGECLDLIKQKSRNYAKRQYTWFNNQMDVKWFDVDFDNFDNTVNEIVEYIN